MVGIKNVLHSKRYDGDYLKISRLPNGLTVITEKFPSAVSVATEIGVRYGGMDTSGKIAGSAHFLEHMLFKGTKKRTWKEITNEIERKGGHSNAYTSYEHTAYWNIIPKEYFIDAIDVLADMYQNSIFDKKEFEKERTTVISELLQRKDIPRYVIYEFFPKTLYTKNPIKNPSIGNEKTLKNISKNTITGQWKDNYTAKNTIITVVGNIEHKKILRVIKEKFNSLRPGIERKREEYKEYKTSRFTIKRKNLNQMHLAIGFRICNGNHKDVYAIDILESILHERIKDEIREKRGLSYAPSVSTQFGQTFGFLCGYANIKHKDFEKTRALILDEFKKAYKGKITKKEFEERKMFIKNSYLIENETTEEAADTITTFAMLGDPTLFKEYPKRIESVKFEDVKKVAKKYLKPGTQGELIVR